MEYLEQDCTITHQGKSYSSGGAFVSEVYLIAYPGENGILNDWHGKALGSWRVLSSWPVRSCWASRMYSIEARVDGVRYVGRGFGKGMMLRAKRSPIQDGAK